MLFIAFLIFKHIHPFRMMLLTLILSCMIAGSFACSDDHCKDISLANELMEVKFLPSGKQLETLCPKVLTFLECEKGFFECSGGSSLEDLASSSDLEKARVSKAMLSGMSFVRDLCDEDSSLHDDYIESVDCFRDFISVASRMCREDVFEPIQRFFEEVYPSVEDRGEAYAEISCLRDAFEVACIMDNLGDSCGSVAQRTAMTALEKLKDAIKSGSCAGVENAADLKSRFLDFLELEDEERSKVQGIFDLFKRRR
ncbi:unnamed protein product [Larinioides sclopetarius]|uniref:DUF19 domain-containing protein n=1 Tax=Larinioides sclopetarius TaxID=280406 RepID=A0AAV1ZEF8_9ARAC